MTTEIPTTAPQVAPPPGEPAQSQTSFERIIGAFFSPDETFADIARKPNVLVPLMIVLVLSLVSGIILAPRLEFESVRAQMERTGKLAPEDIDRNVRMAGAMGKVASYASPVLVVIIYVIIAAVLLLAFRLMGGEGTFKQALSVVIYAFMPRTLLSIILTIVIAVKGSMDVGDIPTAVLSNPGFLVTQVDHPVLFSLLTSLDLFALWTLALLIIGFAYVSRFSKTKSATIILSLWGFVTFCKLGFAALGALRMKQAG